MAPKFGHMREKGDFIRGTLSRRKDHQHGRKIENQGHEMSLTRKLMLSAELWGMEASVNFQQVYTMPCLQTLGMPISLAFLIGVVSGPASALLLPFMAWMTDRGTNPQHHKLVTILVSAGLLFTGMLCLLVANFLHFQDLLDFDAHKNSAFASNTTFSTNASTFSRPYAGFLVSNADNLYNASNLGRGTFSYSLFAISEGQISAVNVSTDANNEDNRVPFKAGLGMLGFMLLDIGFDATNCFVKAFVVSCSPRAEHTSLLLLGLVMASLGGVCSAVLGLVDFTSLLGLDYIEGVNLTLQSSVQGAGVILMVGTGLLITLITGNRQLKHLNELKTNNDHVSKPDEVLTKRTVADSFGNSIYSSGEAGMNFDPHLTLVGENPSSVAEDVPLLLEEEDLGEEIGGGYLLSASVGYGAVEQLFNNQAWTRSEIKEEGWSRSRTKEEEEVEYQDKEQTHHSGCIQNPKTKIAFLCLAAFFSGTVLMMVSYCISDFIGKAVFEGDPNAAPGSKSLSRYQEGMRMASWAFLVYYITCLVASIVHSRILAFLGYQVEYVLLHVLMLAALLIVAMTTRLEAVFVLIVIASIHRMCYFSVPFAVANDIAQSMAKSGEGSSHVGLFMSLISVTLPLSYCLLFSWAGALEDITGDPSVPLYLGSAFGCLSVIAFLFVGKV